MRMTRTAAVFAALVVLGAVSHKAAYAVSSRSPANDYTHTDSSVPVKAFVYADHTVIELDSYTSALRIKDDSGGTVSFTRVGRYARLDGKLNHFIALVDGDPVEFTRKGWNPPRMIQVGVKVPVDAKPLIPASGVVAAAPAAASETVASAIAPASAAVPASSSAPAGASAPLGLAPNEKVVKLPPAPHPASGAAIAGASVTVAASGASVSASSPAKSAGAGTLDVATVTLAASGVTVAAPTPPVQSWTLRQGRLVGHELRTMGARVGWNVVWQLQRDVVVPADTTYTGDFEKAAGDVITTLASNGLLIHAKFYQGNKTMVVSGPGTVPQ